MENSTYQPPCQYSLDNEASSSHFDVSIILQRRDTRTIKLQQIEHKITMFQTIRIFMAAMLLITISRLIHNIYLQRQALAPHGDILLGVLEIFGYFYGFVSHSSRSYTKMQVFFGFTGFALLTFGYFCYESIHRKELCMLIENAVSLVFNIILMSYSLIYIKMLKERDTLQEAIAKTQQQSCIMQL